MTNKEILSKELVKMNNDLILGICSEEIEKLTKVNLNKVIDGIDYGTSTDVDVFLNRKPYVVEISYFDEYIDFIVITKEEYISRYGNERYL